MGAHVFNNTFIFNKNLPSDVMSLVSIEVTMKYFLKLFFNIILMCKTEEQ